MSAFLTKQVIESTILALQPGIKGLLDTYQRKFLHCVAFCDGKAPREIFAMPLLGKLEEYPKPYDLIAHAKAVLAATHRMNTGEIVTRAPQLLEEGDVIWQGGVYLDGIVVATSGAPAPVDEAVSMTIACALRAYCQTKVKLAQEWAMKNNMYTIPTPERR